MAGHKPGNLPAALLDRLTLLGLEAKEARVYVLLALHGPLRAGEIATRASLHRTDAYRATERLVQAGFATASLGRPTLFEAVDIGKAFDDAVAARQAEARALEAAREEAVEKLARLREADLAPAAPAHRLLHGRPAIYAAVDGMLRRAQEGQWMASTYFAPQNANPANAAYTTTLARAEEGLPMRLLLRRAPGFVERLEPLLRHGNVEVRFLRSPEPLRFTIVDGREILVWLHTDPSPSLSAREDAAMWTNAPDFVASQKLLYGALWDEAEPATAR